MMNTSIDDQETKQVLEEYETQFLKEGMEIFTCIIRVMLLILIVSVVFFQSSENPIYLRAITLWPAIFIMLWFVDKYLHHSKTIIKALLLGMILVGGFWIILFSIKNKSYSYYETWSAFIIICQYFGILLFVDWIIVVCSFYIFFISYAIWWNLQYDNIPFSFFVSFLFVIIIFSLICILISKKLKEIIILLKTKKDLVHTIQTILKVLPEGVIIRSFDPITKKVVTEFANDHAQKFVENDEYGCQILRNININSPDYSISSSNSNFILNNNLADFNN